jgi:hypothetical protein
LCLTIGLAILDLHDLNRLTRSGAGGFEDPVSVALLKRWRLFQAELPVIWPATALLPLVSPWLAPARLSAGLAQPHGRECAIRVTTIQ